MKKQQRKFTNNLGEHMAKQGISNIELAEKVDVTKTTISNIARMSNEPRVSLAVRISKTMGVPVPVLFPVAMLIFIFGISIYLFEFDITTCSKATELRIETPDTYIFIERYTGGDIETTKILKP